MDTGTGQMRAPAGADTAANIYGLYVRPYPANSSQDGLGVSTPPTSGEANVMKRGYMTVRLYGGVAVKGAMCNIGVAGATGGNVPGGITATAVTTGGVAMTNCYSMGPADATGMTEVAYNI
jgi:hypothetical protein